MKMREITNKELENIVLKQPSAFLCGNGFSINFDNDFTIFMTDFMKRINYCFIVVSMM